MIYYNDILDISNESLPTITPPKDEGESSVCLSVTRDLSDIKSRNYIPKKLILDKSISDILPKTDDIHSNSLNINNFLLNRSDFSKYEDKNR
jgi:hypothetical protein